MIMKRASTGRTALTMAFAAALVLAAGAASVPATASGQSAVVLEYKMPAARALTYQIQAEEAQVLDVMGQTVDTHSTTSGKYAFKAKGPKDANFLLGVTIDDMTVNVGSSAQGDMSPDMSAVKGKSFDMVLSPLGAEVDVTGAEAITYSIETETRNLANGFKTFFPDLPGKPVKVGDTWPASTAVEEKTGAMTIQIQAQLVHKLEGFETVDGLECAKISAEITGTLNGAGSQMGQDMSFTGTTKGKEIWYFAVKEGLYVKATGDSTSEVSIDVPSAGMTIPMTMTSKSEVKLTATK